MKKLLRRETNAPTCTCLACPITSAGWQEKGQEIKDAWLSKLSNVWPWLAVLGCSVIVLHGSFCYCRDEENGEEGEERGAWMELAPAWFLNAPAHPIPAYAVMYFRPRKLRKPPRSWHSTPVSVRSTKSMSSFFTGGLLLKLERSKWVLQNLRKKLKKAAKKKKAKQLCKIL